MHLTIKYQTRKGSRCLKALFKPVSDGSKGPTVATGKPFEEAVRVVRSWFPEHSGHVPMNDEPRAFAEAVKRFCQS